MKRQLIIGDLHFGVYANSAEWLESQVNYLMNDILSIAKKNMDDLDSIVFLGDLFDVRYSLNIMVGCILKEAIRKFIDSVTVPIYIVAGNHDFYSEQEETSNLNSYELLFGKEFTDAHPSLTIITNDAFMKNDRLFLPWFATKDQSTFRKLMIKYKPSIVYCHTDLEALEEETIDVVKKNNITVLSGHIHYPTNRWLSPTSSLYNLGAALPLKFNDVNSDRYVYLFEGSAMIEKYLDTSTLQFRRYFNEEIFNVTEDSFKNATTQLYILDKYINTAKYIEQLEYIKETFGTKYKISIQNITDEFVSENNEDLQIVTNINKFIEDNMPTHLVEKYNYIKNKLKEE